ncbi:hypothetical protein F2Q69_00061274 [Brassica cretica]|uniref:Tetratricopeptide repeat protein 38 n=1 Tax=Brassica cretica TaxID=69181 RepID=A0A8S9RLR3_BRACR|nr:hypothetical protein F2Q69_00061274 [Brassica cretica]
MKVRFISTEKEADMFGGVMRSTPLQMIASLPLTPILSRFIYLFNSRVVLGYGREKKVILEAPLYDKDCVLGNVLAAHYLISSDVSRAKTYAKAAESHLGKATPYEKAVFKAVNYLISDHMDEDVALELHSKLLKKFPKDLLSWKRVEILCFYMGRPDLSLPLFKKIIPENRDQDYVYGMLAFPLLELGHLAEAEKAARKGYEINKNDSWAHHCVYMDALGLLLRLDTRDKLDEFLDRLKILANCLTDEEMWYQEWLFDITIIWALSKVGNTSQAHVLLEGLKSRTSKMSKKKQQLMQKAIQVAEAVYEYGKGNYKKALELLGPDFDAADYKVIGASDLQMDVFNEIWYKLLLLNGKTSSAIKVLEKRIRQRDGAPFLWRLLEKSYAMEGNTEAVITACEKAKALEASYFKFD